MPRSVPAPPKTGKPLLGATLGLLGLIVLVAMSAASYAAADRWLQHTIRVEHRLYQWQTALHEVETNARSYILSNEPPLRGPYEAAARSERQHAAILGGLVADHPIQQKNFARADRDALGAEQKLHELTALVGVGLRDQAVARLAAGELSPYTNAYRADELRIENEEEQLLALRRSQVNARGKLTLFGGALLTLASTVLLAFAWRRERAHDELVRRMAIDARERLASLFQVAAALASAGTRTQVADVIVEQGMRAVGADTCTLYLLNESETALELIAERGVAKGIVDVIQRISSASGSTSAFTRMRDGQSLWAESEAEYLALFPALATMQVEGPRAKAFWSVPLQVESRAIGLLGMGFYRARPFSKDDRAYAEAFTRQCAQALLRAQHLEREDEAHRWFTTTLRSIGDAVIATDSGGRIEFMNPIAEALTGWNEQEAKGRPLSEVFWIFSEETGKQLEDPVSKVLREGKVVALANHTALRSRTGVAIPIEDSGAPIRGENGELFGVVMVFRDATIENRERARREFLAKAGVTLAASLDSRATLATVAQLAVPVLADWCAVHIAEQGAAPTQVAIAHVDPAKANWARELAERYPADPNATAGAVNVIRTGVSELYTEIPPTLLEANTRDSDQLRALQQLQLRSAMVVPLRTRGRTLGAMTFIRAESGRRYGEDDLAFAEDFARRAAMAIDNAFALKEAEDARSQERLLRGEAEVASRAKDDFLATVSHELRTPLNAILGWALMLRERRPDASIDRGLAVIERNARAQAKLIEDVLDVSRIISGKLALNLGPTLVSDVVAAAVETVTPAAAAKHITLVSDPGDSSLTVLADPDRLQQIVWNLLSNAVKFTPKNGKVMVRTDVEGSSINIRVSDNGEGIRPDALPFIFDPFQQADASTTRRHGGLGLGLAIVKQLVSAHGGNVTAESDGLGKGATFIIRLPMRTAVPALQRPDPLNRLRRIGSVPHKTGAIRLDGLRLLLVDDEQDALLMLSEVLRERGAAVQSASSAQEALQKLISFGPDVLVSDIGMPGEDGYTLIREVRALPAERGGQTPALALTAYARSEDAQRALAAGYQIHLTKPIEPAQLATAVATLGQRRFAEP